MDGLSDRNRSENMATPPDSGFLLLDARDNILICVRSVPQRTVIMWEGEPITLSEDIALGHKIARYALAVGDKVYRYGFPIGTITHITARGQHVHHHNLASDYISAHDRTASSTGNMLAAGDAP